MLLPSLLHLALNRALVLLFLNTMVVVVMGNTSYKLTVVRDKIWLLIHGELTNFEREFLTSLKKRELSKKQYDLVNKIYAKYFTASRNSFHARTKR